MDHHGCDRQGASDTTGLGEFRAGFYRCLTGWADAAFELTDVPRSCIPRTGPEPCSTVCAAYHCRASGSVWGPVAGHPGDEHRRG